MPGCSCARSRARSHWRDRPRAHDVVWRRPAATATTDRALFTRFGVHSAKAENMTPAQKADFFARLLCSA